MSSRSSASASSSQSTVREWHWIDEPEPRPVPESWTNQGAEPLEGDREHWYAVAYKAGTQLEWTVDQRTGEPIDGPHGEDHRIAVVYVRGDCKRALVGDYRAERGGGGWRPIAREYLSIRAFPSDAGGPVSPRNDSDYLAVLEEYYSIEPGIALRSGGESA